MELLKCCNLCPRKCEVNRYEKKGFCGATNKIKLAYYSLHMWEEPVISGTKGSGTIFFSNCNLNCKYCQNYEISQLGKGKYYSIQELADIFISQQRNNAENINLVTPTMYVEQIIQAIKIARKNGLKIPIIYNSNGYENVETIKMLDGYIDVYLPDLKYSDNTLAYTYSNIKNYFETATSAIKEMYNQVGNAKFDENGMIVSGIIIRHLILPNYIENSKNVLKWIKQNMPEEIYISVMAQYFPTYLAKEDKYINRKLTQEEYNQIENYIYELDFKNGYMQDLEENEEQYVPKF